MARLRRSSDIELNSDGLTDAVTNLTGTLILLVVLMFGITHDVQPEVPPPSRTAAEMGKPIASLRRKIEMLKLNIQRVDAQIRGLEQRIPALEQEVDRLHAEPAEDTKNGSRLHQRGPVDRIVLARPAGRAGQRREGLR